MESSGMRDGNEWRHARFACVTGTDVAKILGVDSSVSRRRLFACKLAHADPTCNAGPFLRNLLQLGKVYEPAARDDFITQMHRETYPLCPAPLYVVPGMEAHRGYSWITGTPDLFICDSATGNVRNIVEIKCHFYPDPLQATPYLSTADLPLKHWLQVQTYMEIKNVETGHLWSWTLRNGATLFNIRRMKNTVWNQCIFPAMNQFHDILTTFYDRNRPVIAPRVALEHLTFNRGEKEAINRILKREFDDTVTSCKRYLHTS